MINYEEYSRSPAIDPDAVIEYVPTDTIVMEPALILGDKPSEVEADIARIKREKARNIAFLLVAAAGVYFLVRSQM